MKLYRKHRIHRQTTAEYTPQQNAYNERWFRTNRETVSSQLLQFDMDRSSWRTLDDIQHGYTTKCCHFYVYLENHGYHQYRSNTQSGTLTDLSRLHPFGTECWTHITKARRSGKRDGNPRGQRGILVGYDDETGTLLARVYFPDTGVFE